MSLAKYKFAIMLNGLYMYPWQRMVFDQIIQDGLADCSLLIIREEPKASESRDSGELITCPEFISGSSNNNTNKSKRFLKPVSRPYSLFEQFKKRKLNNTIYKPLPIRELADVETIKIFPEMKNQYSEFFPEEDIEKIKSKRLDFIIRFGFGIIKGEILNATRWGIWSFHYGDEQKFRATLPGFWEIMLGERKGGVILQKLTKNLDTEKIILKRQYSILSHSYTKNVTKLLTQSADMPAQALRMISNALINIDLLQDIKTTVPVYHYPTNLKFLQFKLKLFINKLKFKWLQLFKQENWILGYRTNPYEKYQFISPAHDGEYYADPFIFYDNNKPYIVAEHYSYNNKKGNIILIEPGMNQVKTILEKNTHLSYPYTFEENGIKYMLPEESNSGHLNLYKWNGGTKNFDFIQSILNLPAVDASLLKHKGKYYLFTGIKDQLPDEKLFIYYADQIEGPYLPHLGNPVKVSPEGSRMAGGFIITDNQIIRPAQYSVKYYGEKVVFQKIIQLSPVTYEEEFYTELKPMDYAPFKCGLHTYNKNGNFEVIDLKTMQSDFSTFKSQL